jgi:hypothetical protein
MKMAGRTTMGEPQGKGLVIRKLKRVEEVEVVEVEDPESAKHESGGLKSKIPRVRSTNREG